MTPELALTAKIESSRLADGREVWVGSVVELPGVFTQADTKEAATDELIALVNNLQERVGHPVVGLNTPAVAGWLWYMQSGGAIGDQRVYGSVPHQSLLGSSGVINETLAGV